MTTKASDIAFVPQVASQNIAAYFERNMGLGSLALIDRTLTGAPGETVTFPYWKTIGDVEEPSEDNSLQVDKLSDDSFTCTVKEVGKAVGWKDKANRKNSISKSFPWADAKKWAGT